MAKNDLKINSFSGLEDQTDEATKALIEEIKNEYNMRRLDRHALS